MNNIKVILMSILFVPLGFASKGQTLAGITWLIVLLLVPPFVITATAVAEYLDSQYVEWTGDGGLKWVVSFAMSCVYPLMILHLVYLEDRKAR